MRHLPAAAECAATVVGLTAALTFSGLPPAPAAGAAHATRAVSPAPPPATPPPPLPAPLTPHPLTPQLLPPPPLPPLVVVPVPPPPPADPALRAAVERIPGYAAARPARWELVEQEHLGSTVLETQTVTISRRTPSRLLDDVVRHEWAHVLQVRAYAGDVPALLADTARVFGGPGARGVRGAERAADCMARELGATWTHYTSCRSPVWRSAARELLAGRRL